jgi:hypothetical protein
MPPGRRTRFISRMAVTSADFTRDLDQHIEAGNHIKSAVWKRQLGCRSLDDGQVTTLLAEVHRVTRHVQPNNALLSL